MKKPHLSMNRVVMGMSVALALFIFWSASTGTAQASDEIKHRLKSGETLERGSVVQADKDDSYQLALQEDGNLVLFFRPEKGPRQVIWATHTNGRAVARATMQDDGNFVLYDYANHAVCSTRTQGNPGASLTVQLDGNIVMYAKDNHRVLWASKSGDKCR